MNADDPSSSRYLSRNSSEFLYTIESGDPNRKENKEQIYKLSKKANHIHNSQESGIVAACRKGPRDRSEPIKAAN